MGDIIEDGPTPLYLQLEALLRRKIERGAYQPGDSLPSEQELVDAYDVSRTTVRQALSRLAEKQLVVKVQGKGTYVSKPSIRQELDSLQTLSEILTGAGLSPEVRIISVEMETTVPIHVRSQLQLTEDALITRIKRQHLVEGEPVAYAVIHLSNQFQWRFAVEDLKQRAIYSWLEQEEDVVIESGRQVIRARAADEEIAAGLGQPLGAPVLYVENTATTREGIPIDYTEFYFPAERYALQVMLQRTARGVELNVSADLSQAEMEASAVASAHPSPPQGESRS